MNDIYIKLLVDNNSLISSKIQTKIISFLFDTFVQYTKDTLFIYDGTIKVIKNKQSFLTIAKMILSIEFAEVELMSYDKKSKKTKWNIKIDEIYDTIISINSYSMLRYKTNLFADKQEIVKDEQTSTITVINNKVHIKEVKKSNINEYEYKEIVKDYKSHFPQFDDFLQLIVDMRFAKDRKASFLHLRVRSDWGKSFLSGLLKNIEIGFEVDYHNLMNKGANDIAPIQVRNSFVLMLDEFNNFSQEMKKLSHEFTFAPKFGMSETVELYLKVLMSAEKSASFSGGVDTQIINRVMVFDIDDTECMKLIDREIYNKHGNAKYMRALEYYVYLVLKKRIEMYLKLDEFAACKTADDRVRETYNKYKMQDIENINDKIKIIINDKIKELIALNHDEVEFKYKDIHTKLIKIDRIGNQVFVKSPLKVFEFILKNETAESEFKKMKFKLVEIVNILDVIKDHTKYPKTKFGRGLSLNVANNKIEIIHETISKEAEEVF